MAEMEKKFCIDLLHRLHQQGYPTTKQGITSLNTSLYKEHKCRGQSGVRRATSHFHSCIQNNQPPQWLLNDSQMLNIFKLVVINCKQNYKPMFVVNSVQPSKMEEKQIKPEASQIKDEFNEDPGSNDEELLRLKQHVHYLETKLQAKEMEIDELKIRCEARNDRLHQQSTRLEDLQVLVEQKNKEIGKFEERMIQLRQLLDSDD